ncbi:conserved hypothetical protein [Ricinus communis]|uniref:Uncharacterized protein n=1 Tax=Ricinus communis TaxID=3988 RepID=B9T7C7_RICCO|nr:conserved hypothetical protein [Ricinus communis]
MEGFFTKDEGGGTSYVGGVMVEIANCNLDRIGVRNAVVSVEAKYIMEFVSGKIVGNKNVGNGDLGHGEAKFGDGMNNVIGANIVGNELNIKEKNDGEASVVVGVGLKAKDRYGDYGSDNDPDEATSAPPAG